MVCPGPGRERLRCMVVMTPFERVVWTYLEIYRVGGDLHAAIPAVLDTFVSYAFVAVISRL